MKIVRPMFVPSHEAPFAQRIDVTFFANSNFVPRNEMKPFVNKWHKASSEYMANLNKTPLPHAEKLFPILECSTAAGTKIGASLSAHNLAFNTPNGRTITVEAGYQGSKVFEHGGPYHNIYNMTARAAKVDKRLKKSGKIVGMNFFGEEMNPEPKTAFFNWLFLNSLIRRSPNIVEEVKPFTAFTDIFLSKNGINCQARAVAMAVGLSSVGKFTIEVLKDRDSFWNLASGSEV